MPYMVRLVCKNCSNVDFNWIDEKGMYICDNCNTEVPEELSGFLENLN